MQNNIYTDFGLFCRDNYSRASYFQIRNFKLDLFSVIDEKTFSFNGLFTNGDGKTFYCTFDFNIRSYQSLLDSLPEETLAYMNSMIDLNALVVPSYFIPKKTVLFSFDAILGQKQYSEESKEEYIPFNIVIFHKHPENKTLSVDCKLFTHSTKSLKYTKRAAHCIAINRLNKNYYLYMHLIGEWGLNGRFNRELLSKDDLSREVIATSDPSKRYTFAAHKRLKIVSKYKFGSETFCITTLKDHQITLFHMGDECLSAADA